MRPLVPFLALFTVLAAAQTARADDPSPSPRTTQASTGDDLSSFPYTTPPSKHYLRAALEVGSILIVGNVDYLQNTTARGGTVRAGDQRWDLKYDWPTFKDKLTGDYYRVDTNHFNTNYISHPFAGTFYYTAARSNHLSIAESFGYSAVAALAWEYFGELREEVSINDAIVTECAGMGIGEPLMQLRAFFRRSAPNVQNDVLAVLMAPVAAINDFVDGGSLARSERLDHLGFTRDVWHRFEVWGGAAATWQEAATAASPRGAYADEVFGIEAQLVNLPGWLEGTDRTATYGDGNVSSLRFDFALSRGDLAQARLLTRFSPAGVYVRSTRPDTSTVLGLWAGFEYSVHDFDRDRARPIDLDTVLSPIGVVADHRARLGRLGVRTRLEILGDFAGVTSYALDDYRAVHSHDDTNLQTVLRLEGYYHALGVTAAPTVELDYGAVELGGTASLDTFRGIEGFDERQDQITHEIPLSDRRVSYRGWVGGTVPGTGLHLEASAQHFWRIGEVGSVRASRNETSLVGRVGLRF